MKIFKLHALCSTLLFILVSAYAQGSFQDLDFESATLAPLPSGQTGGYVPITAALPGWSASIGSTPVTQVLQNNISTGQASIEIYGPNFGSIGQGIFFGEGVIDGSYTVFLQSGSSPIQGIGTVNVSLSQIGTIPTDAQSLEFKAWSYGKFATFSVSFDGNSLSPVVLSSTPNATGIPVNEYGVNIAAYAGQTGQLEFASIYNGPSWTEFDDITFSPIAATPEPGTFSLFVLSGLAFAGRRWRAKRP